MADSWPDYLPRRRSRHHHPRRQAVSIARQARHTLASFVAQLAYSVC